MNEHYCGGYECDNPAEIEVLAGRVGGTLGWLCEDCATEIEQRWEREAERNRRRLEVPDER